MERPESSFKEKLLRVLRQPFCLVEYKKLLRDATVNLPATKIRQTRRGVKYYNSTHEINQSYFDSHPGLFLILLLCNNPLLVFFVEISFCQFIATTWLK